MEGAFDLGAGFDLQHLVHDVAEHLGTLEDAHMLGFDAALDLAQPDLFDLEAAFLIPWAVSFRGFVEAGLGVQMFVAMTVFFGMLVVGLIYEWRKGALEWE